MVSEYLWARLAPFHRDDSGAVTVDWVVLTSVTVLLATIVMPFIWEGTSNVAQTIPTQISSGVEEFIN